MARTKIGSNTNHSTHPDLKTSRQKNGKLPTHDADRNEQVQRFVLLVHMLKWANLTTQEIVLCLDKYVQTLSPGSRDLLVFHLPYANKVIEEGGWEPTTQGIVQLSSMWESIQDPYRDGWLGVFGLDTELDIAPQAAATALPVTPPPQALLVPPPTARRTVLSIEFFAKQAQNRIYLSLLRELPSLANHMVYSMRRLPGRPRRSSGNQRRKAAKATAVVDGGSGGSVNLEKGWKVVLPKKKGLRR
ncbi:hypothetical protein BT67DRAFT_491148 [Trichocladium antarcticum]|uniref:Uncharacterized protein n=1 Tax=Trichocladium antarcticum TaxID=1450529 RepID=A0AAN6UN10_9PEZI|nr:hypothetical protein BT67DRAFT_491148 [Trichocladium antarcticum]